MRVRYCYAMRWANLMDDPGVVVETGLAYAASHRLSHAAYHERRHYAGLQQVAHRARQLRWPSALTAHVGTPYGTCGSPHMGIGQRRADVGGPALANR